MAMRRNNSTKSHNNHSRSIASKFDFHLKSPDKAIPSDSSPQQAAQTTPQCKQQRLSLKDRFFNFLFHTNSTSSPSPSPSPSTPTTTTTTSSHNTQTAEKKNGNRNRHKKRNISEANAVIQTSAAKQTLQHNQVQRTDNSNNSKCGEQEVNGDENRDFISYNDIKRIFDKIDREYEGDHVGELENNHHNASCHMLDNHELTNCELYPPILECSENGESDVDEIPIWERNQRTLNPFSFCLRVEDESKLAGESNFVLIHISDINDFYCSNQNSYYLDSDNDAAFGALFSYNETGNLQCSPQQEASLDGHFVVL